MAKRWQGVALLALLLASTALAGELAGVTLPDTTLVGDTKLNLNGMGLRKKLWVKVYVGALYVKERSSDPSKLLAADTPRQMVMHFLYEVGSDKLIEAWKEGFAGNSAAALPALQQRLDQFCALWRTMKVGESAVMTYVPGAGTKLEVGGKELGVISGKDFADALLAVWVGDKPPTTDLKKGILGK